MRKILNCMQRCSSTKVLSIVYGKQKFGIVSSSYKDLLIKIRRKFLLNKEEQFTLKLEDGTEIDGEFYDVLDNKTKLYLNKNESLFGPLLFKLELFLKDYDKKNIKGFNDMITDVSKSGDFVSLFEFFSSCLEESDNYLKNNKHDHPLWFQGLNTKFTTKCDVMRNNAETRMRSYFQKLKSDMEDHKNNKKYIDLLQNFQGSLKAKRYNSSYFDRTASANKRLCNEVGQFQCYGAYNCENCPKKHSINPYESKETRILFSTWNFDHVIEKSRAIIPALKKTLDTCYESEINFNYFFDLMFEHYGCSCNGNLKLVHIVCHDKTPHELKCDSKKLFLSRGDNISGSHLNILKKRKQRLSSRGTSLKKLKESQGN